MSNIDFYDYAKPMLLQLEDDPDRPPPTLSEMIAASLEAKAEDNQDLSSPLEYPSSTTSFPGGNDIAGDLMPIQENDDSIIADGIGRPVSTKDVDAARGAYPMAGTDVLAFYKSFRFKQRPPFPDKWGIFLLDAGVAGLTAEMTFLAPRVPIDELRQLAIDLLLAHERYHFWIDAWALGQEIAPLTRRKYRQYVPYLYGKKQAALTQDDHEESLANHYAFQRLKRRVLSDGTTAFSMLRHVLELAPLPYCVFSFDKSERAEREGLLALAVANGMHPLHAVATARLSDVNPSILSGSIEPAVRWHPIVGPQSCPIYYVHTHNYAQIIQPFQGPDLTEFRRYVSGYLKGEFLEHTDHDYYRIDNGEKVKVPNPHDKTVRGYELKGTLYKAGMTHKEFLQERQRTKLWTRSCPRPEPKPPF